MNRDQDVDSDELIMMRYVAPSLNPALFTDEEHKLYLAESPELDPKASECVVHVRCNGICGSDVHFWKHGRIGTLEVNCPYILGHEAAGVIVWTGDQVRNLEVGDRVAIEPGVSCGGCFNCLQGRYNLCPVVNFSGAPPHHGCIRRFHVHPAKFLHKLPDSLSYADGALLEPLSVVLHGYERSPIRLGESTVICGAGPIGVIALAAARASGASPIVITDVDQHRLDFALKIVPGCKTVRVSPEKPPDEMAAAIREQIGSDPPRVVYECSGVQSSVILACYLPRPGGEVMFIGVGKPKMDDIPFMHTSLAEIDLKFINRYHHSWPLAIRVLTHGILDLKPLITHNFPLERSVEALEMAANRTTAAMKIHITDEEV